MFQCNAAGVYRVSKLFISVIAILYTLLPFYLHAEIYRWVDENDRVHYDDKALSENAKEVIIKKSESDKFYLQRQKKRQKLLDIYQEDREKKRADREEQKKLKAERLQYCNKVKKDLEETRQASYLYEETNDSENPRVLSKEERTKAERDLEEAVDKWCS